MANHASAKKRIRQNARRRVVNRDRRSQVRTAIKAVIQALKGSSHEAARTTLGKAESQLMKAVSKGVYRKQTASRKISRLSALIKKQFASQ